jgi:2-succinyl-6-hydroxy-2,4-cyclohexadiene-1-carboxylate synthase
MTALLDAGDGLVARTGGGDGEGILWFHGYTMDASVFADVWAALPRWRHVGVELPGHGASRALRDGEDLAALAATIAGCAARLRIRHLVGLSFGTLVALQVAATRPDAFATLVLAAPALAGAGADPAVERRYVELAALYRREGPGPHMTRLWMASPPDIFRHAVRRPAVAARLAASIDRHGWRELEAYSMQQLAAPPQDGAVLERVRAATLLLVGEHELTAHITCAAAIAATVPSCTVRVLAGAGHLALLEEPEAAAHFIAEHLTRSPSARAR